MNGRIMILFVGMFVRWRGGAGREHNKEAKEAEAVAVEEKNKKLAFLLTRHKGEDGHGHGPSLR
jgi:hypothetical protein